MNRVVYYGVRVCVGADLYSTKDVVEKSAYDKLAEEYASMKQMMSEACAGRDQWRSTHLENIQLKTQATGYRTQISELKEDLKSECHCDPYDEHSFCTACKKLDDFVLKWEAE